MPEHPSGISPAEFPEPFASQYRAHLQHLQLKGLRPKTKEAYAHAMRPNGAHFQFEVSALSPAQLADCLSAMKAQHFQSGAQPPRALVANQGEAGQDSGQPTECTRRLPVQPQGAGQGVGGHGARGANVPEDYLGA